jgi:hypothetical protein
VYPWDKAFMNSTQWWGTKFKLTLAEISVASKLSGKGCDDCAHCNRYHMIPKDINERCDACGCQWCVLTVAQVKNKVSTPLSLKPMWYWTTYKN